MIKNKGFLDSVGAFLSLPVGFTIISGGRPMVAPTGITIELVLIKI